MGSAVVYYSAQGNSALAARALAGKLGAKLVELKEIKRRKLEGFGMMRAAVQSLTRKRSRLSNRPWQEVGDCSELHLITPIWAGNAVPAINTFVLRGDFTGRRVTIYTVQADPGADADKAREWLKRAVTARGGEVAAVHGLVGGAVNAAPNEELPDKIVAL